MQRQWLILNNARSTLRGLAYKVIMAYWAKKIDIYIVGYPKTGTTWFWLMLSRLLVKSYDLPEEDVTKLILYTPWKWPFGQKLRAEIPVIYTTHNMPGFWSDRNYEMNLHLSPFKGKRIILLIREPKDTLVSLYFHNAYRRVPSVFTGSMTEMVYDETYGIESFLHYYKTWYDYRILFKDVFLVRYEDHRENPVEMVRNAADFIGINNLSDSIVEDVVAFSSFDNMKNMEKRQDIVRRSVSSLPSNGFKVRKGKIGGYKEYLSEETIRYVDELVAKELPAFYHYTPE